MEILHRIVKPFLLVIARDTTHAAQLLQLIESDEETRSNDLGPRKGNSRSYTATAPITSNMFRILLLKPQM